MNSAATRRILVTGATGFLGRHIVPALERAYPQSTVVGVGRKDCDLLHPGAAEALLRETRPDTVVHLAAKVGGLFANKAFPADFFHENVLINTCTFDAAYRAGVTKFLTCIGGCSYPGTASSPIAEDRMWDGFPEGGAAAYSVAKKMVLVQSEAYRRQHGFNSVVLVPGNVYGEYDNFSEEYAHVIPAMIRRFVEAADSGADEVSCYGSGRPTRDFVYAADVAATVPWFLDHYDSSRPVNISSGTRTSIRELSEAVARAAGYKGRIAWDTSKSDGQMDKIFSVDRLRQLGLSCPTPLEQGLHRTVTWFRKARAEGTVRL